MFCRVSKIGVDLYRRWQVIPGTRAQERGRGVGTAGNDREIPYYRGVIWCYWKIIYNLMIFQQTIFDYFPAICYIVLDNAPCSSMIYSLNKLPFSMGMSIYQRVTSQSTRPLGGTHVPPMTVRNLQGRGSCGTQFSNGSCRSSLQKLRYVKIVSFVFVKKQKRNRQIIWTIIVFPWLFPWFPTV